MTKDEELAVVALAAWNNVLPNDGKYQYIEWPRDFPEGSRAGWRRVITALRDALSPSSSGRTSDFGSEKRGSNPRGEATAALPPTPAAQGAVAEGWRAALMKARMFVQHAIDTKNTFAVGKALVAEIDAALAAAPVVDEKMCREILVEKYEDAYGDIADSLKQEILAGGPNNIDIKIALAALRKAAKIAKGR